MRRFRRGIKVLVAVVAILLTIDYVHVRSRVKRVAHSISQFGGRCGSIGFWPLGAEYRITLPRALTTAELDQLVELNSLRGAVYVGFIDCELSREQTLAIIDKLHKCKLFRVINHKTYALTIDSQASP
jgi:hypothetical protein